MGRFNSPRQAQRLLAVHDQAQTVFRPRRHTLSVNSYRHASSNADVVWNNIARELAAN